MLMAGLIAGLLNRQIAAQFGTSESTVKEQRAQVLLKMQAASLADLVPDRPASRHHLSFANTHPADMATIRDGTGGTC
jgi:DNA-binding NarL/FixJ family response regulator